MNMALGFIGGVLIAMGILICFETVERYRERKKNSG